MRASAIVLKNGLKIILYLILLPSVVAYSVFVAYRAEKVSRLTLGIPSDPKSEFVLIGDSRFRDVTIQGATTFYFSGETSPQITLRAVRIIEQPQVKTAIVQFGINDIVASSLSTSLAKKTEDAIVENISYLIERSKALGKELIITEILPARKDKIHQRFYWFDSVYDQTNTVNKRIHKICSLKGIQFITFPEFSDENRRGNPSLYTDSLHLNEAGQEMFQRKISESAPQNSNKQ